jgi:3-phenylpropionate/trans-cinnamate dioxygenase ferredoxin reductase subunit
MPMNEQVLIVGAGQAGAQAAISLRQLGFGGRITMAGAEPDLPYERPPLSKEYLAGDRAADRLLLRPPAFWAERDVDMQLDCRIVAVDPKTRRAATDRGEAIAWDWLIWAAGGHARRLSCPGAELGGVHVIRTRDDVDRLRSDLHVAGHVAIVGGGYIGLEAAAVLAKQGRAVTVLEAMPRLMARVAGPEVSDFYLAEHRRHGVDVRLGAEVEGLEGQGRVEAVRLAGGERLAADVVIAGIGLVPEVGALLAAGAEPALGGVMVDAHCRTALTGVYAIGDCAAHANHFAGGQMVRLESVQNAVDMAKAAAAHIVEGDAGKPYGACPWFWSNQYDLRLQTVGLSFGADARVVRGDPASRSWSLAYLRAGVLVALDCINMARDYGQGRALVERGARPDPARLADPGVPLKELP